MPEPYPVGTSFHGAVPSPPEAEPELPALAPDSVVITLRLPEEESATGAPVATTIEAGGYGTLVALVRNQSGIVDNYELRISGIPEEWASVAPSTVYLVPYGAPGGEYEQEVHIQLNPPRTAEAEARAWPIQLVAVSKAHGVEAGRADATLTITPYYELESEVRPERASGRRRASFAIAIRNRANAPVDVQMTAIDPDNTLKVEFAEPVFTVKPGRRNGTAFTARPPKQIWIGRPIDRNFQVAAQAVGTEAAAMPRAVVFKQKAWLPRWLLILLPLLIIAAVAAFLLWPRTTTVPDLTQAKTVFEAQQLLKDAKLELGERQEEKTDKAKPGTVLDQAPPAGEKVKKGSTVAIKVAVGTGTAKIPDVAGMSVTEADAALRKAGFALGAVEPPADDPNKVKIASQVPAPDELAQQGAAVNVFLEEPKAGGGGGNKDGQAAPPPPGGGGGGGGPPPITPGDIAVPALAGLASVAATDKIVAEGLVPVIVNQFSATVPAGQLIEQIPPKDTKVAKGTKVQVVISKGYPDIAFERDGNLFVMSGADGKKVRPLAKSDELEEHPNFSPTGALIAYRRGDDIVGRIWILNPADPQSARPLTEEGFDDRRPAFSPNGKVIAFVRGKDNQPATDHDLCFKLVDAVAAKPSCVVDAERNVSRPAWSPDGRAIVLVASQAEEEQVELQMYTSAKPSSGRAADWFSQGLVTDGVHNKRKRDLVVQAAFAPDGKRLALTANWGAQAVQLFLVEVKNNILGKAKPVPQVGACEVSWRTDSGELAITRRGAFCDDPGEIARVDPAKPSAQTNLTKAGAGNPVWSPVARGG